MDSLYKINEFSSLLPNIVIAIPIIGEVNLTQYIFALIVFFVFIIGFKLVQTIILVRLKSLSKKTDTDVDDMFIGVVHDIRPWVYSIVAFFIAIQTLSIAPLISKIILAIFLFAVVWQGIEILVRIADFASQKFLEKDTDGDGEVDSNSLMVSHMVSLFVRIILWAIGGLFVLSNLGVEVTSLIAGLGIGGIAVAFALQGILSDLFSSFSLFFDKPFRIGDYIVIGEHSGTVERIGIKTTRLRTLQGEELVISNSEITTARVQNFKKMRERRINFQFGVTYETEHSKIKEIPGVVGRIFEAVEGARLDRVHFTTFGDSALLFDVVFYVETSDYAAFLDIQQKVNFELMDKFSEMSIEFAYPTQTLYMKNIT